MAQPVHAAGDRNSHSVQLVILRAGALVEPRALRPVAERTYTSPRRKKEPSATACSKGCPVARATRSQVPAMMYGCSKLKAVASAHTQTVYLSAREVAAHAFTASPQPAGAPAKHTRRVRRRIRQTHDHEALTLLPRMVLTRPQTAMLADTSEAREARTGTALLRLGPPGRKRLRDLGMVRRRAKSSERVRNRRVEPKRHRGIDDIYARASGTRTAELRVPRS